jgi:hypothetical protein
MTPGAPGTSPIHYNTGGGGGPGQANAGATGGWSPPGVEALVPDP